MEAFLNQAMLYTTEPVQTTVTRQPANQRPADIRSPSNQRQAAPPPTLVTSQQFVPQVCNLSETKSVGTLKIMWYHLWWYIVLL